MCKYCEDDFSDILFDEVPLKFGVIDLDNIQANVFINDTEGYELMLFVDNDDYYPIIKKSVPIKFCPMCGRSLITERRTQNG